MPVLAWKETRLLEHLLVFSRAFRFFPIVLFFVLVRNLVSVCAVRSLISWMSFIKSNYCLKDGGGFGLIQELGIHALAAFSRWISIYFLYHFQDICARLSNREKPLRCWMIFKTGCQKGCNAGQSQKVCKKEPVWALQCQHKALCCEKS